MTLAERTAAFLEERKRENVSPHTLRNYGIDLAQFTEYFTERGGPPAKWTPLILRGWLAWLHDSELHPASVRRKLAAVRSFFQFMLRQGWIDVNVAKLLRTPKAPKTLPRVMTEDQMNGLVDGIDGKSEEYEKPFPERDRALLELLYGCGVRVSELVGLDLGDLDLGEGWMRVRGKGKKERQVPIAGETFGALQRYLLVRQAAADVPAVFTNHRGGRLTDRGARGIVKFYSRLLTDDPSVHPHSFRHAYATHLLTAGADLRAIQELLGHAKLSTTQKYTQLALHDLMAVYDKAHPKA
jgi:integrase/recombinase XerC